MTVVFRIILIVMSLATVALMLGRIRKQKVRIEDSLFWIGLSVVLLLMSIFPQLADGASSILHIYQTTNFLFLFFIFILLLKLFSLSMRVSQLQSKLDRLVQELALESKGNQKADEPGTACSESANAADDSAGSAR